MNLKLIQQELSLTAYTVTQMLKDPNSLLAKKEKADEDFIINCEAKILHKLLCEKYYLLDLEKQREKAIEEFELYEAYRAAQETQSKNNAAVQDNKIDSILTAQFTTEAAQQIAKLMDALLTGIAQLNQLQAVQANLLAQINQQAAQPAALQAYRAAQVARVQNILSATYVLPNGKTFKIDQNTQEAQELLARTNNLLLPDQVFKNVPELAARHEEIVKAEEASLLSKGHSPAESVILARQIVDDRVNQATNVTHSVVTDFGAASLLRSQAKSEAQYEFGVLESLNYIEFQRIATKTVNAKTYTDQSRQETVISEQQQAAIEFAEAQIALKQAEINKIQNMLGNYIQFASEQKKISITENSRSIQIRFFKETAPSYGIDIANNPELRSLLKFGKNN